MRMLRSLFTLALFGATVAIACDPPTGGSGGESTGDVREAICNKCDPPDLPDPPECTPKCAGKACGASDGCHGHCGQGSCPAGTTCGGGGVPFHCGCTPQCAGKACGDPDSCGGTCAEGACPGGLFCSASGVPGQCGPINAGQGVECFVFDDGYANMAGPSQAIYLSMEGQACIPDGTSSGTCRRWFGRCRTTDLSHTPVNFRVFDDGGANMTGFSDAVFAPAVGQACVPGGPAGDCRRWFGEAQLADGRDVRCNLFDDGGANKTQKSTDAIRRSGLGKVCDLTNGTCRKWFGECKVAGCGDGTCADGETPANCPADCKCGDGVCNGGETCGSCAKDCGSCCGNGVCNAGETCSSCPSDCGSCCGDGACNNGETCNSCAKDCGACAQLTCSGQTAGSGAQLFAVGIQNFYGCAVATQVYLANSLSEASSCGQAAFPGYTIVTQGTPLSFIYHTDPTFGCASSEFVVFSSSLASSCAMSQGYSIPGPCP